ncbi:hypothetical protein GS432_19495 [Rhodococcus hoagii]|nr:hypothetical protein [Prescottella equi]MBM4577745.1 hypothetical protein [Prescottella equi]
MTDDIVTFLRARLDEDDEAARDAAGWDPTGSTRADGRWSREGINSVIDSSLRLIVYGDSPAPGDAQAEHIARHDPARVLREIEAKRRILDRAQELHDDPFDTVLFTEYVETVLPVMAATYSDHPDYQPHWTT